MKRILAVLGVVGGLAVAGKASAQTIPTTPGPVFVAVDAVRRVHAFQLVITGVVDGASDPSDVLLSSTSSAGWDESISACERYAMQLMSKPGQYRLETFRYSSGGTYWHCRLTKLNP